ncbi:MAG TPA: hypothetical protein VKW78_16905 [Terriglobales bacterium]|nr:hypothetical protein [Terriglobales bacterium]
MAQKLVVKRIFLTLFVLSLFAFIGLPVLSQEQGNSPIGIFDGQTDVGENPKPGSATYDAATGDYRVTGGGANIWAKVDAFHFLYKKLSGDVTITADVKFEGAGAVPHRKAVLMVRQSLDPDSAYADVARHGNGLTSLQFRPTAGADTQEVQSKDDGSVRIQLVRRGSEFTIYTGKPGEKLIPAGPARVILQDPVYVGIGVCSHDANVLETAVFSNVKIEPPESMNPTNVRSRVTIYDLKSKSTKVLYTTDHLVEAPNWSPDGKYLLINTGGRLYRLPVKGKKPQPELVNLDAAYRCNNDHGPSPDGKLIAFSANYADSHASQVFVANADGSNPKLLTPKMPSYFHGWSPDGKWLTFVGQRDSSFNIFRVPLAGGNEERLTSHPGYDDGPDYSPDGKWIYINSNRSGTWDIWRFPADGAGPNDSKAERITSDALEDWFAHPSPNGKWLVFLSFPAGTPGHDAKLQVQLRMMPMPGAQPGAKPGPIQTLTQFFGGQGTINVNSWSPDSKRFAYVVYEVLPEKK